MNSMGRGVRTILTSVILVAIALAIKTFLLGGAKVVTLKPAPPLTGIISQGLINTDSKSSLMIPGKDFTIDDTYHFSDPSWIAVSIVRAQDKNNTAILLLHTLGGVPRIVLGPGTAFPASYLQALPTDVGQYLQDKGAVYESGD